MPRVSKKKVTSVVPEEKKGILFILELLAMFSLGLMVFLVLFVNAGFLLGFTITKFTLPIALIAYVVVLIGIFLRVLQFKTHVGKFIVAFCLFVVTALLMSFISVQYFSQTYDTSWDGQGYHSNGVIALSNGWNPMYQKELPIQFPDAEIFVQGYPKAVWTIQSLIYTATGDFNSGKITNLYAIVIAFVVTFLFLRKVRLSYFLSGALALVFVLQPPFIIQINTFQADLFSYQMTLIAVSALGLMAMEANAKRYVLIFVMAMLLLIGAKFSNLYIVVTLGVIFMLIQIFNQTRLLLSSALSLYVPILLCSILFISTPFITNIFQFGHPVYPSNLPEVSETYRQDNVPKNLSYAHNGELFIYGLFSKSQVKPMGNDDPMNIAELKMPFTFTNEEIKQSVSIYNNRVGSAGPLYSGIVVLTLVLIFFLLIRVQKKYRNHALVAIGLIVLCLLLTILSPASNMLRYNVQIVFFPFIALVAALLYLQKSGLVKALSYITIAVFLINALVFTYASINQRSEEDRVVTKQLQSFKDSNLEHKIYAQNFYSNYIRLEEYGIPYRVNNNIDCYPIFLEYTFYTTKVCPQK